MASVMIPITENFDMELFVQKITENFRAQGYKVASIPMENFTTITFEKDTGGINTIIGMGQKTKATITKMDKNITISFSDGDWTGKIIGYILAILGFLLCIIPCLIGICPTIGLISQLNLPKEIENQAMMIATSMK